MTKLLENIRKKPGMYIGRLGDGSSANDGIYTLLEIVLSHLVCLFRRGHLDNIKIEIKDGRTVSFEYPETQIEQIETVEALSGYFEISEKDNLALLKFVPDEEIFKGFLYDERIVSDLLKSYCCANKGLKIIYNGATLNAPNGILDLIKQESKDDYCYPVTHLSETNLEIAFTQRANNKRTIYSFVNGIPTKGGSHQKALEDSLVNISDGQIVF